MPNHVHIVFKPLRKNKNTYYALPAILHSLKLYTARRANIILQRTGTFWQHENYDHVIRDESEWHRIVKYVLNNPVKAGLTHHWEDWKWTYCKHIM